MKVLPRSKAQILLADGNIAMLLSGVINDYVTLTTLSWLISFLALLFSIYLLYKLHLRMHAFVNNPLLTPLTMLLNGIYLIWFGKRRFLTKEDRLYQNQVRIIDKHKAFLVQSGTLLEGYCYKCHAYGHYTNQEHTNYRRALLPNILGNLWNVAKLKMNDFCCFNSKLSKYDISDVLYFEQNPFSYIEKEQTHVDLNRGNNKITRYSTDQVLPTRYAVLMGMENPQEHTHIVGNLRDADDTIVYANPCPGRAYMYYFVVDEVEEYERLIDYLLRAGVDKLTTYYLAERYDVEEILGVVRMPIAAHVAVSEFLEEERYIENTSYIDPPLKADFFRSNAPPSDQNSRAMNSPIQLFDRHRVQSLNSLHQQLLLNDTGLNSPRPNLENSVMHFPESGCDQIGSGFINIKHAKTRPNSEDEQSDSDDGDHTDCEIEKPRVCLFSRKCVEFPAAKLGVLVPTEIENEEVTAVQSNLHRVDIGSLTGNGRQGGFGFVQRQSFMHLIRVCMYTLCASVKSFRTAVVDTLRVFDPRSIRIASFSICFGVADSDVTGNYSNTMRSVRLFYPVFLMDLWHSPRKMFLRLFWLVCKLVICPITLPLTVIRACCRYLHRMVVSIDSALDRVCYWMLLHLVIAPLRSVCGALRRCIACSLLWFIRPFVNYINRIDIEQNGTQSFFSRALQNLRLEDDLVVEHYYIRVRGVLYDCFPVVGTPLVGANYPHTEYCVQNTNGNTLTPAVVENVIEDILNDNYKHNVSVSLETVHTLDSATCNQVVEEVVLDQQEQALIHQKLNVQKAFGIGEEEYHAVVVEDCYAHSIAPDRNAALELDFELNTLPELLHVGPAKFDVTDCYYECENSVDALYSSCDASPAAATKAQPEVVCANKTCPVGETHTLAPMPGSLTTRSQRSVPQSQDCPHWCTDSGFAIPPLTPVKPFSQNRVVMQRRDRRVGCFSGRYTPEYSNTSSRSTTPLSDALERVPVPCNTRISPKKKQKNLKKRTQFNPVVHVRPIPCEIDTSSSTDTEIPPFKTVSSSHIKTPTICNLTEQETTIWGDFYPTNPTSYTPPTYNTNNAFTDASSLEDESINSLVDWLISSVEPEQQQPELSSLQQQEVIQVRPSELKHNTLEHNANKCNETKPLSDATDASSTQDNTTPVTELVNWMVDFVELLAHAVHAGPETELTPAIVAHTTETTETEIFPQRYLNNETPQTPSPHHRFSHAHENPRICTFECTPPSIVLAVNPTPETFAHPGLIGAGLPSATGSFLRPYIADTTALTDPTDYDNEQLECFEDCVSEWPTDFSREACSSTSQNSRTTSVPLNRWEQAAFEGFDCECPTDGEFPNLAVPIVTPGGMLMSGLCGTSEPINNSSTDKSESRMKTRNENACMIPSHDVAKTEAHRTSLTGTVGKVNTCKRKTRSLNPSTSLTFLLTLTFCLMTFVGAGIWELRYEDVNPIQGKLEHRFCTSYNQTTNASLPSCENVTINTPLEILKELYPDGSLFEHDCFYIEGDVARYSIENSSLRYGILDYEELLAIHNETILVNNELYHESGARKIAIHATCYPRNQTCQCYNISLVNEVALKIKEPTTPEDLTVKYKPLPRKLFILEKYWRNRNWGMEEAKPLIQKGLLNFFLEPVFYYSKPDPTRNDGYDCLNWDPDFEICRIFIKHYEIVTGVHQLTGKTIECLVNDLHCIRYLNIYLDSHNLVNKAQLVLDNIGSAAEKVISVASAGVDGAVRIAEAIGSKSIELSGSVADTAAAATEAVINATTNTFQLATESVANATVAVVGQIQDQIAGQTDKLNNLVFKLKQKFYQTNYTFYYLKNTNNEAIGRICLHGDINTAALPEYEHYTRVTNNDITDCHILIMQLETGSERLDCSYVNYPKTQTLFDACLKGRPIHLPIYFPTFSNNTISYYTKIIHLTNAKVYELFNAYGYAFDFEVLLYRTPLTTQDSSYNLVYTDNGPRLCFVVNANTEEHIGCKPEPLNILHPYFTLLLNLDRPDLTAFLCRALALAALLCFGIYLQMRGYYWMTVCFRLCAFLLGLTGWNLTNTLAWVIGSSFGLLLDFPFYNNSAWFYIGAVLQTLWTINTLVQERHYDKKFLFFIDLLVIGGLWLQNIGFTGLITILLLSFVFYVTRCFTSWHRQPWFDSSQFYTKREIARVVQQALDKFRVYEKNATVYNVEQLRRTLEYLSKKARAERDINRLAELSYYAELLSNTNAPGGYTYTYVQPLLLPNEAARVLEPQCCVTPQSMTENTNVKFNLQNPENSIFKVTYYNAKINKTTSLHAPVINGELYILRHIVTEAGDAYNLDNIRKVFVVGGGVLGLDWQRLREVDNAVAVRCNNVLGYASFDPNGLKYTGPFILRYFGNSINHGYAHEGKHNIPTSPGDCGSVLLKPNGQLFGIHFAGGPITISSTFWNGLFSSAGTQATKNHNYYIQLNGASILPKDWDITFPKPTRSEVLPYLNIENIVHALKAYTNGLTKPGCSDANARLIGVPLHRINHLPIDELMLTPNLAEYLLKPRSFSNGTSYNFLSICTQLAAFDHRVLNLESIEFIHPHINEYYLRNFAHLFITFTRYTMLLYLLYVDMYNPSTLFTYAVCASLIFFTELASVLFLGADDKYRKIGTAISMCMGLIFIPQLHYNFGMPMRPIFNLVLLYGYITWSILTFFCGGFVVYIYRYFAWLSVMRPSILMLVESEEAKSSADLVVDHINEQLDKSPLENNARKINKIRTIVSCLQQLSSQENDCTKLINSLQTIDLKFETASSLDEILLTTVLEVYRIFPVMQQLRVYIGNNAKLDEVRDKLRSILQTKKLLGFYGVLEDEDLKNIDAEQIVETVNNEAGLSELFEILDELTDKSAEAISPLCDHIAATANALMQELLDYTDEDLECYARMLGEFENFHGEFRRIVSSMPKNRKMNGCMNELSKAYSVSKKNYNAKRESYLRRVSLEKQQYKTAENARRKEEEDRSRAAKMQEQTLEAISRLLYVCDVMERKIRDNSDVYADFLAQLGDKVKPKYLNNVKKLVENQHILPETATQLELVYSTVPTYCGEELACDLSHNHNWYSCTTGLRSKWERHIGACNQCRSCFFLHKHPRCKGPGQLSWNYRNYISELARCERCTPCLACSPGPKLPSCKSQNWHSEELLNVNAWQVPNILPRLPGIKLYGKEGAGFYALYEDSQKTNCVAVISKNPTALPDECRSFRQHPKLIGGKYLLYYRLVDSGLVGQLISNVERFISIDEKAVASFLGN